MNVPNSYFFLIIFKNRLKWIKNPNLHDSQLFLDNLSPADVRTLAQAEDELSQCHGWTRAFPSPFQPKSSEDLLPLLKGDTYSDMLLAAWERKYWQDRSVGREVLSGLCKEGRHLVVPQTQ